MILHDVGFDDLDARTLHDIVRLRIDVFVVEQDCPYPDLDGLDVLPTTRHLWLAEDDGTIGCYLRILQDHMPQRIGRVVTAPTHRRQGLARRLMTEALSRHRHPTVLSGQVQAADLYLGLGFVVDGPEYLEDGIPHLPMSWTPAGGR